MKHFLIVTAAALMMASCGGEESEETKKTSSDKPNETDTTTSEIDPTDTTTIDEPDTLTNEDNQVIIDDTQGTAAADNVESKVYDLSEYGYNMTIELPEGCKISVGELDECILQFGQDFELWVQESFETSVADRKTKFKNNRHNQNLGYLVDEVDGYVVKIKSNGVISHNLFYLFDVDGLKIEVINAQGKGYSYNEIMAMQRAVKTMRVKAASLTLQT